jgi:hypothetical protein
LLFGNADPEKTVTSELAVTRSERSSRSILHWWQPVWVLDLSPIGNADAENALHRKKNEKVQPKGDTQPNSDSLQP